MGPLGWGWQGPRQRPGLILASPAPVGILVVGTPSPWRALPRLWDEAIVGAVRQRGVTDTAARNRDDKQMAPSPPPTLDELRRMAPELQSITAAGSAPLSGVTQVVL